MTKAPIYFLALALTSFSSGSSLAQSVVDTDSLAIVTVEIKEPKTKTEADFKDVRETLNFFRDIFRGPDVQVDVVRQHPRTNAACNTCHTTGKLAIHDMAIFEPNPSVTCATCHSLEKAGEMPFYTKGYVSLAETAKLSKAHALLLASFEIRDNLNSYLQRNAQQKVPDYKEVKLIAELVGRGQQQTAEESSPFIEAKPQDLVPGAALAALSPEIFELPGIVTEPTVLEIKLEAKVQRAADLTKHLGLLTTLAPVLEPDGIAQVTEVEIKDEYKPPLPMDNSLALLQSLVATQFPTAVVTKDETKSNERKYEWEVPGNPKAEIKFEWKNNDKTKIEFKKLPPANEPAALLILNGVQAQFSDNTAKRERKTKTESKETVLKETKITLNYKPFALPPAALTLLAQQVAIELPEAVLKKQETNKIEWEIPGNPKGEIKAEIKHEEGKSESKIEFKKLAGNLHEASMGILASVQEAYPDIPNVFAKYEWKFEAKDATQKATLIAALANLQDASAKGDFLFEVKHKADNKGTVPMPMELPGLAEGYADASGDAIRQIRNEIKLEKNLALKEIKTDVVSAAPILYRAVQGVGAQDRRVGIERNIAQAQEFFGFNDFDNNIAGDGWALVGRTNGAASNGVLKYFFLVGSPEPGNVDALIPVVRIEQQGGGRCIETSPLVNRLGLSEVRKGQTRIMEPVVASADGSCRSDGILGTGILPASRLPNQANAPLGPTVQINARLNGAGQFSIRYPQANVNAGRRNARIEGEIVCLNAAAAPIQVGGRVKTSNSAEWPVGSYLRFGLVDDPKGVDRLGFSVGEENRPDCMNNPHSGDLSLLRGNFSVQR